MSKLSQKTQYQPLNPKVDLSILEKLYHCHYFYPKHLFVHLLLTPTKFWSMGDFRSIQTQTYLNKKVTFLCFLPSRESRLALTSKILSKSYVGKWVKIVMTLRAAKLEYFNFLNLLEGFKANLIPEIKFCWSLVWHVFSRLRLHNY